ncbi:MAG: peptide-methionine (R)-S-oxide reductase MsrB [bacterium]|nr:peptide-methionine (R)-S-oxide reductase MsrB [bacterium]
MKANQQNPHLSEEQKRVLFGADTEMPFTGKLLKNKKTGIYTCANCGHELFKSQTKFDSGSGWPSFYEPINSEVVNLIKDNTHGMERVEATCANCGAHMGHVFYDAPEQPTGLRFCINSASLDFKETK